VPSFAPTRLRAPLLLASSAGLSAIAAVIIAALSSLAAVSGLVPTAAAVGIGAGLVAVDGGAVALVVAWCTWPRD
jgi:hypothetical protein